MYKSGRRFGATLRHYQVKSEKVWGVKWIYRGAKIDVNVKPVLTSRKLSQTLSVKENKPPIVNTQCVVYLFQCDLCDANYVVYTTRHLHQRVSEHRHSVIGKHLQTQHGNNRTKTDHLFTVLKKCNSKFDCLVYEMLYIKDISKPSLNTQADSIRAKLFTWHSRTFFLLLLLLFFLFVFLPWGLYP